ncbi:MAG: hypothetical protein Ta2E_11450 [Mycoplasmoidaceae bacterium]|nr:MAG: hypothetical protein Ta2E_11450 [Mycoplasmoidaceae bacterium]
MDIALLVWLEANILEHNKIMIPINRKEIANKLIEIEKLPRKKSTARAKTWINECNKKLLGKVVKSGKYRKYSLKNLGEWTW